MNVMFRVDASIQIGTGHVMRCVTLADALKSQGENVQFICREHQGNLIQYIRSKGFNVHILPLQAQESRSQKPIINDLYHAHWLQSSQLEDAKACRIILNNEKVDWLIVDHYAIDQTWEKALKGVCQKLMVIDDLADRNHDCDILLDQTAGRDKTAYLGLVPPQCKLLLGTDYALLRPEFLKWREHSYQRRASNECKHLLITMGGVDADNVTSKLLKKIVFCEQVVNIQITVILGKTAPFIHEVNKLAKTLPYEINVIENADNMAELMAKSDVCIGAAGATSWERCCLGLPSLMVVLADNQKFIASALEQAGAAKVIHLNNLEKLCNALNALLIDLDQITTKSFEMVDGLGVKRVLKNIT